MLFRLGVPRPVECRLPGGHGGVGEARQCVSDTGVIDQRIFVWDAPRRLAFRMEKTNLPFRSWLADLSDEFELVPIDSGGTRIVRTTRVELAGRCRIAKAAAIWVGLKKVHRFVFGNWGQYLSEHRSSR